VPRTRIVVLLLAPAVAVAATVGVRSLLFASNDGNLRSHITQTTQPLPPARSVGKDVPGRLIPFYQAAAAECPGCHGPSMPPWASCPAITAETWLAGVCGWNMDWCADW
jgi:hypothetical protein